MTYPEFNPEFNKGYDDYWIGDEPASDDPEYLKGHERARAFLTYPGIDE